MAINIKAVYPANADSPSLSYITGSFRNDSSPESEDGTPLEMAWANDFLGARDALLQRAGITPSGDVETANDSDVLDAIEFIVNDLNPGDASESTKGVIEIATSAEAVLLTDGTRALTPKKLNDAFQDVNQSLAASGYQKLPGGLIMQWGVTSVITSDGRATITLPMAYPTACLWAGATAQNNNPSGSIADVSTAHVGVLTVTSILISLDSYGSAIGRPVFWQTIGY
jgi:hypothetical protein